MFWEELKNESRQTWNKKKVLCTLMFFAKTCLPCRAWQGEYVRLLFLSPPLELQIRKFAVILILFVDLSEWDEGSGSFYNATCRVLFFSWFITSLWPKYWQSKQKVEGRKARSHKSDQLINTFLKATKHFLQKYLKNRPWTREDKDALLSLAAAWKTILSKFLKLRLMFRPVSCHPQLICHVLSRKWI